MAVQRVKAFAQRGNCNDVFLEDDLLRRLIELYPFQPARVCLRSPALPVIALAVAQQER